MTTANNSGSTDASAASAVEASTFRFIITSDNHLGYLERDARRGEDSFTTFEEVLRIGRLQYKADAMLLGGDLLHENKPSLGCLVRVSSLLRKYVFGDKSIEMELLSDPAVNFPTHAVPLANFQDPNVNIALPVFAIHGNHDDPVGGTSALDILSTNSCINYFGHTASLEDIHVEPVLLRKGQTYVALYGLGHIRDERLLRCFRLKKVHFASPPTLPESGDGGGAPTWFRLLVVHQNRGNRPAPGQEGTTLPTSATRQPTNVRNLEQCLSEFGMDLVIWGNEHMQQMAPQTSYGYDIIQPGSTIRTALPAQYVSPPKQCGILEIRSSMYRLTPVTLQSVRPFVRRVVTMATDFPRSRTMDAVEAALRSVVNEMVLAAQNEQVTQIPEDILSFHPNLKYPLLSLAVDFSDSSSTPFPQPNYYRLGQEYMEVVANPQDMVKSLKRPSAAALAAALNSRSAPLAGERDVEVIPVNPSLHTNDIRAKIAEIFNAQAKDACGLLSEVEVSAAVYAFAEKGERSAIDERILELLSGAQKTAFRKLTGRSKASTATPSGSSSAGSLCYGDDAVLSPDAIAAVVARHKQEVNRRYAEAMQQEAALQEARARQQQPQPSPHHRHGGPTLDGEGNDPLAEDGVGGEEEEDVTRDRASLDQTFTDTRNRVTVSTAASQAGLLHGAAGEEGGVVGMNDPLLSRPSSSTAAQRRRAPIKHEEEEQEFVNDGERSETRHLVERPPHPLNNLDGEGEVSDTDSLDELLLASRRMLPADAAIDQVLQRAEQLEYHLQRAERGDGLPLLLPGGSSSAVAGSKRNRSGPSLKSAAGPAASRVGDEIVVVEEDDEGVVPGSQTTHRRRGGAAPPARQRRTRTTSGSGGAALPPPDDGEPQPGRGRGGRRRPKNDAGGGEGGSGMGSLPLYVPGSKPAMSDSAAVNFLSAWASQGK